MPEIVTLSKQGPDLIVVSELRGRPGRDGDIGNSYTFQNADLTIDKIVFSHTRNRLPVSVTLFNQDRDEVVPANVRPISTTAVEVDLTGWTPITGAWEALIT